MSTAADHDDDNPELTHADLARVRSFGESSPGWPGS